MPPKETNGDWLSGGVGELYIGTPSGGFVPYDAIPVIEEGFIMADEEGKQYKFYPSDFTDMNFTATGTIRITRTLLKMIYTGRSLRRAIRKLEKERRKRLKEAIAAAYRSRGLDGDTYIKLTDILRG
jgi:hypothetical protein